MSKPWFGCVGCGYEPTPDTTSENWNTYKTDQKCPKCDCLMTLNVDPFNKIENEDVEVIEDYEEISNESLEVTENSLQKIDKESQELVEFKNDVKEDFQYARANIKKLIDTGMEAVENIANLVNETESARFAECLANFLSINSVNNTLLLDLDNRYKNLINGGKESDDLEGANITQNNNTIFFGTTSQIQKMIEDKLKGKS